MARKTLREESAKSRRGQTLQLRPLEERGSPAPAKDVAVKEWIEAQGKRVIPQEHAVAGKKAGKLFIILDGKTATWLTSRD